jgi:hypothetical protein
MRFVCLITEARLRILARPLWLREHLTVLRYSALPVLCMKLMRFGMATELTAAMNVHTVKKKI